jgi:glycosyltransferase involved in cell wall biosynthesis
MINKIYHLAFAKRGGAGNVAFTVSEEMKSLNYDSNIIYLVDERSLKNIIRNLRVFFFSAVDNYIIKKNRKLPFFSVLRAGIHSKKVEKGLLQNSLIHMHWIPGLVNLSKLVKFENKNLKMVVTLHDMWFFTGGCHFSNGCTQYISGCQQCPMVHNIFRPMVAKQYLIKKEFFSIYKNTNVTSPSHDLLEKAARSEILNDKKFHLIANPVSNDIKFFGSKIDARKITNIDPDCFVVGFVAADINDPRKNFKDALAAVKNLVGTHPEAKIKFIVIGGGYNLSLSKLPFIHRVGLLKDPILLAPYYAAFDVLLLTSNEENSPLVVIEALVNKSFVIASNSGGAKELINSDQNGYIYENSIELSNMLKTTYESKRYKNTRFENIENYFPTQIANEYTSLYETLK